MLDLKWAKVLKNIQIEFEPIVSANTANVFAYCVKFQNVQNCCNYFSIHNLYDDAFDDGVLYQLDIELRKLALLQYDKKGIANVKLIYPLDNRLMYMPDYKQGNTDKILHKLGWQKERLIFEVSDRNSIKDPNSVKNIIATYKASDYEIILNDFGVGMSSLQLLYFTKPLAIKLDPFFTKEVESSIKKRNFLKSIIELAHSMEIFVIAKNIETKELYYQLKELGVDYVQGAIFSVENDEYEKQNQKVLELNKDDKRLREKNKLADSYIRCDITPIYVDASLHELFVYFQKHPNLSFVPVIDRQKRLSGVIHEVDIKKISYSQYGLALAKNDSFGAKLANYIKPAASVEITWGIDKALELYNQDDNNKGIFVTKDGLYYGFISVRVLLELSYKRNLQIAQSQNPLTKLPGNSMIERHIQQATQKDSLKHFVYFDFNDFKPFNDSYGFRQGDRAILMFSDILKKRSPANTFLAHVGGDDFFAAFDNQKYEAVYAIVESVCSSFKNQASSLYKQKDRENGYVKIKDRFGIKREFKLLSVSAAIFEFSGRLNVENLDNALSPVKKASKKSDTPVGVSVL